MITVRSDHTVFTFFPDTHPSSSAFFEEASLAISYPHVLTFGRITSWVNTLTRFCVFSSIQAGGSTGYQRTRVCVYICVLFVRMCAGLCVSVWLYVYVHCRHVHVFLASAALTSMCIFVLLEREIENFLSKLNSECAGE